MVYNVANLFYMVRRTEIPIKRNSDSQIDNKRMRRIMADIKYEIVKELGVISESAKGWTKELNLISWNDKAPKYDIRDWAPEHEKMGKGITLTKEEAQKLSELLSRI